MIRDLLPSEYASSFLPNLQVRALQMFHDILEAHLRQGNGI